MLSASVLRFCMMAARWNSWWVPESPLNRMRSKPWSSGLRKSAP